MQITVPKIGSGHTLLDGFRPETSLKEWQVIEERATEFVIEILEEAE